MYNNSLWVKTTNKVPFASAQSENIPENKLANLILCLSIQTNRCDENNKMLLSDYIENVVTIKLFVTVETPNTSIQTNTYRYH